MRTPHRTCEQVLKETIQRCRERNIIIPTVAQQQAPETIPRAVKERLAQVALSDVDAVNLFRITWKNEPTARGGGFNHGNWIEFPPELTGVPARIIGLIGKHFPTGSHKVGAAFGCLVPRLVSGGFDPTTQKAVWPSTGNYCRGGAFDCALLACPAVAILPEGMSRERFEWLKSVGADVIKTPGSESNVKEIFDKCWEIRRSSPECVIFNQFEEFGNAIWNYHVTGGIVEELFQRVARPRDRLAAFVSATGSGGTIAAADYLRTKYPLLSVVAAESLQCPTMLNCGFGDHHIEGIGDKHIPWIHNVRNTDMVCAIDDRHVLMLSRLFNEETGHALLHRHGLASDLIARLPDMGLSSICNLLAAIKTAKYYEMDAHDVILMPLTDSMDMYMSRIAEQRQRHGPYSVGDAALHFARCLESITLDYMRELSYYDRKALHHLKYFTWVEQQQRRSHELLELWDPEFWSRTYEGVHDWDRLIRAFNEEVAAPE